MSHYNSPGRGGPLPSPRPPHLLPGQADCCPSGAAHITLPLCTALHPKIGAPYPLSGPCASRYHSPRHSEVTASADGVGCAGDSRKEHLGLASPSIHSFIHSFLMLPFLTIHHLSFFARLAFCLGLAEHLAKGAEFMNERERTVQLQNCQRP